MEDYLLLFGAVITIGIFATVYDAFSERKLYKEKYLKTFQDLNQTQSKLATATNKNQELEKELHKFTIFYNSVVDKLREDSVLFPSLINKMLAVQELKDDFMSNYYKYKKNPALKAAEEISKTKHELREKNKEFLLAYNRVELYESLALE